MNERATDFFPPVVVEIGGLPIALHTSSEEFRRLLEERYAGFVRSNRSELRFDLEIELVAPGPIGEGEEARVRLEGDRWSLERGDFRAEWIPGERRGRVRQSANPYSIDSVLRILHTLLLAREGGFLLHAASAVRNGRAFLFAGRSGAGKTTLSRLAPPGVRLLSDEVSYVVRTEGGGYRAFGTPFAGELGRAGENLDGPVAALYLLGQGPENRIAPVEATAAAEALLANMLFFAADRSLVSQVFEAACEFVARVPTRRLWFVPDARVWELIS